MTSAESQPQKSESLTPNKKDVAIVGAGIAGLTCALRLSQRGYDVTLYEKEKVLGGDLSSTNKHGMYHDVYTHLFCDWYENFWRIVEDDLKIKRDDAFEPRLGVKLLDDPSQSASADSSTPIYRDFKNPNTLKNILDDLLSGTLPPPDMFLVGFALLDLAAQPFHRSNVLEQQTVNGFLYSRPYVTGDCADLHNTILNEIWCISSNDTSAAGYKAFVRRVLASRGPPFAWLLRGSLEQTLINPWQEMLRKDCDIRTSVTVKKIEVTDDVKVQLTLDDNTKPIHANVVMAVPAPELAKLVMNGSPGRRIVDRVPVLSELQRLRTASILVVTLFFKEKLPNIPLEPVGLAQSRGYLTFIDISQLWTSLSNVREQHTVLILAASDAYAYPSGKSDEEWAHLMIKELAWYLPAVKPGHTWGAADSNIDYSKSWPQNNRSHTLFLNDMNSEQFPRKPSYPELPSVFFAGDFCRNEIKMATVEGATLSGLRAAHAVQMKTEGSSDISVTSAVVPSSRELLALKLALLPAAYAASALATAGALVRGLANGRTHEQEGPVAAVATLALIPLKYVADWLASLENLGVALVAVDHEPDNSVSIVQHGLRTAARGVVAAGESLCDLAAVKSAGKPRGLVSFLIEVLKAVDTASSSSREQSASANHTPAAESRPVRGSGRYRPHGYVRRYRAKL